MTHMVFVTLALLSSSTLVAPLCFGWFDEDDDTPAPVIVNGTLVNSTSTTSMPLFNCQALDDVFSYFNDFYEYLDQTLNPFYEPPTPTPMVPVFNATDLNATSTTPAPA